MNILSTRKIKTYLAKKYLDWAEKLPKFEGGIIRSLQQIREHQRKWSEDCYKRSRLPVGAEFNYKELVLIEVFELENLNHLSRGVKKLFPNLSRRTSSNIIEKLEKNVGNLSSGGWYRLGTVSTSSMIPISEGTIDPTLPPYIEYVSIWLYGITPSVHAAAFTFEMSKKVTAKLFNLQDRYYLSDIVFNKIIPWGPLVGGHSENMVDTVMQRKILDYFKEIRRDCEKWISKYFKGRLLVELKGNGDSLGAIEVFQICGVPIGSDQNSKEWKNSARSWADSYGIPINDSTNFVHDQYSFCWQSSGRERQSIPARILIYNDYQYHNLEFIVSSLVAPMALIHYLEHIRRMVENKRVDVYKSIKRFSLRISRKTIQDSLLLKRGLMILDRLKMELKHNRIWFIHIMEDVNDFKSEKTYFGDKSLDNVFAEHIDREIEYVKEHLGLAEENISDYISMQNIFVMFVLQKRILILSIIVTLATIAGLLINYDKLTRILGILLK